MTVAIHKCTTKEFFVPDLQSDLLGGSAPVTANYRVILDKDPKISGFFPVTNGKIDPAIGLPFLDSSEGLFFVETVPFSETQFKKRSGYSLWHWRLGHCPKQTIRDTIQHAKGIEELSKESFDKDEQCPACVIGTAHLEIRQRSKEHAKNPLERVYMDMMSSPIPSIAFYNYAFVVVDDA